MYLIWLKLLSLWTHKKNVWTPISNTLLFCPLPSMLWYSLECYCWQLFSDYQHIGGKKNAGGVLQICYMVIVNWSHNQNLYFQFFMFLKILGIFDQSCFISLVADTEFGLVYTVKKYKKTGGHRYGGNHGYYTRFQYKYLYPLFVSVPHAQIATLMALADSPVYCK